MKSITRHVFIPMFDAIGTQCDHISLQLGVHDRFAKLDWIIATRSWFGGHTMCCQNMDHTLVRSYLEIGDGQARKQLNMNFERF